MPRARCTLNLLRRIDLTATREITLGPNTVSKTWIIENATTGSQIITIKQGSGATVNVANGSKVMVVTDGAGAGAAVLNANPTEVGGTVTSVGGTGTVNGITLTGTVTSSGNLTLGGTLANVDLTSQVTGTLPIANGGTGVPLHLLVLGLWFFLQVRTPSAATLTNATGLPLSTGVTGQLPLASGGTGASLVDPNADRIFFWDDSAGATTFLTVGSGLQISDTTLSSTDAGGTVTSVAVSGGTTGLTTSGGPVTTSGTITLAGTLAIANGGTNATTAAAAATNLGLGTASDVRFDSFGVGTNASGTTGEIRATNNVTAYYSDDRLKTKLGLIEDALEKVNSLSGFYYEANETAQALGYEVKREVGVSAQEVEAIMPEVVAPAPIDDKYLTVRYEKLIPLLVQAIKELSAKVESLESK
jgi:hypothetical protein